MISEPSDMLLHGSYAGPLTVSVDGANDSAANSR